MYPIHDKSPQYERSSRSLVDGAPFLLALGACPLFLIAVLVIAGRLTFSLPQTKITFLLTEYLVLLPCLIGAVVWGRRIDRQTQPARPSVYVRLILAASVFATILLPLAFSLQLGRYQGDESAYLFEARCLNAGRLWTSLPAHVPPTAVSFAHHLLLKGRWLGKYPPGWPLLLSFFTRYGLEWVLNPLLGLLLLTVTYRIGRTLFGRYEGMAAVAVLGGSAFMILNCLGFMSHVWAALLASMAMFCVILAGRCVSSRFRYCAIAGFYLSIIALELTRPFTALCIGGALLLTWHGGLTRIALRRLFVHGAVMAVLFALVFALENLVVTGDPLKNAYSVYEGGKMVEITFNPATLWWSLAHLTPLRLADTESVSFPFLMPLALFGLWRQRTNRLAWSLTLVFAFLVVGHLVQIDNSDSPIGERYYFEGAWALALLAGYGLIDIGRLTSLSLRHRQQVAAALLAASLAMVAISTAWEVRLRRPSMQMTEALRHPPFAKGIVFVQGTEEFPAFNWNFNDPGSGILVLIDPGPNKRDQIAQSAGVAQWICLTYNPIREAAFWLPGRTIATLRP